MESEKGSSIARFNISSSLLNVLAVISIIFIMFLAVYTRSSTLDNPTVLDYDPWWWYRQAEMILENNFVMPRWDSLSHYPPGRPVEPFNGWSYTIAILYKILNATIGFTLTDTAKWSTLIFAALTVIPAYLLGKLLTDKKGGVFTSIFATLSPALIGVSMAGYCDTDITVVFYTFLTVYTMFLAMRKGMSLRSSPYILAAVLANLAFIYSWGYGWIIVIFFTSFIPSIFIFRIMEQMVHERKLRFSTDKALEETKKIAMPLLAIILIVNVVGGLLGLSNMFMTFLNGLRFYMGQALLVNISVAELQQLNIFTQVGFNAVAGRVGFAPLILTVGMWPLPVLTSPLLWIVVYKMYKNEKITSTEIFLFMWILATFILINRGVRFSLLFSSAAAVSAGYIIGNISKYLKNPPIKVTAYALVITLSILFVSNAISTGLAGRGMQISSNWYSMLDWLNENADPDAMVVTWWDPGHIIAGYTGLHVHADGAHCGVGNCIPYNHNDRIQDMGRVFAIDDEEEAISILSKYRGLTTSQCEEVRQEFGSIVPDDVCNPVPEMYVLASNDLIGKYYWLSYFGTGTGRNYFTMSLTSYDPNTGVIAYNNGQLSLVYNNGEWVPVLNLPEQGIRNVRVSNIVYFQDGQMIAKSVEDTSGVINGMVWVDPGFAQVVFMDEEIKNSIFTRMFFFDGEGLDHFELVFSNPEIRLYRVIW